MGYAKAKIKLSNACNPAGLSVMAEANVDPGSMLMCISADLAAELELRIAETRHIAGPDGQLHPCPYVGPLFVQFGDRSSFAGALVLGSGVWMGSIQLADLDLVIDPSLGQAVANPAGQLAANPA